MKRLFLCFWGWFYKPQKTKTEGDENTLTQHNSKCHQVPPRERVFDTPCPDDRASRPPPCIARPGCCNPHPLPPAFLVLSRSICFDLLRLRVPCRAAALFEVWCVSMQPPPRESSHGCAALVVVGLPRYLSPPLARISYVRLFCRLLLVALLSRWWILNFLRCAMFGPLVQCCAQARCGWFFGVLALRPGTVVTVMFQTCLGRQRLVRIVFEWCTFEAEFGHAPFTRSACAYYGVPSC